MLNKTASFLATLCALVSYPAFASHIQGGNIQLTCLGGNQYQITLTLYEDCGTNFTSSTNMSLTATNNCGYSNPTISLPNTVFQQEVSQLCPNQMPQSECNGGVLPGVYMHQWSGIITLPANCDSWCFSYSSCCWNTSTNASGQPGYYYQTCINSTTAPCNSTPLISAQPIPYVCAGQPVSYSLNGLEPDGHTVVYSLTAPLTSATATLPYATGFSFGQPVPGITINPQTGQINFTPNLQGNFIIGVLVEEFDNTGNLISTSVHYFQFVVINCVNNVPNPPAAGMSNLQGTATQTGPNSIELCEGGNFCFDLVFTDPDVSDILSITHNVNSSLPGATVTVTGTNPAVVTICHQPPQGSAGTTTITVSAEDDACPINGLTGINIAVNIVSTCCLVNGNATVADVLCNGACNGSVTVNATQGVAPFQYSINGGTSFQSGNVFGGLCPGVYDVVIKDAAGCEYELQAIVNEPAPFVIDQVTSAPALCAGDCSGQIVITAAGGTSYSIDGNTFQSGGLFTTICAGTYTVYAQNANGCADVDQITVSEPLPLMVAATTSDAACYGQCDGSVSVTATQGTAPYTYSLNGTTFQSGATFIGQCAGNYTLTVHDANGCAYAMPVVVDEPQPFVIDQIIPTNILCSGDCTGEMEIQAPGAVSYSLNGSNYLSGSTFSGLCAGSYTAYAQNQNGCTTDMTITISEPAPVGAQVITTDAICNGYCDGNVTLSASGGTGPYQYSIDNGSNYQSGNQFPGICAGVYNALVTDANGCSIAVQAHVGQPAPFEINQVSSIPALCAGDCSGEIQIVAPGAVNYSITGASGTSGQFTNVCSGNYVIAVVDSAGCSDTGSVVVSEPAPLALVVSSDTTICLGTNAAVSVVVSGGTTPYTYVWNGVASPAGIQVSPGTLTTYALNVSDANGCVGTSGVTVDVYPPLLVNPGPSSTICEGEQTGIIAYASGGNGGPYTYQWLSSSGSLFGQDQTVAPAITTQYTVVVSDGCTLNPDSAGLIVTVNPLPQVTIAVDDPDGCVPHTVNMFATSTTNNAMCSFDMGNGYTSDSCGVTHTYSEPGCYDVTFSAMSNAGCHASGTYDDFVCVHALPDPYFEANDKDKNIFDPYVTFTNLSTDAVSYVWDFGVNGAGSTDEHPSYRFPDISANYEVCLLAISAEGCEAEYCDGIRIGDELLVFVPNAFSPNDDGHNDVFRPVVSGNQVNGYTFRIFDRGGDLIFESHSPSNGWNGRVDGNDEKVDIYVWQLIVSPSGGGDTKEFFGHVTVLK